MIFTADASVAETTKQSVGVLERLPKWLNLIPMVAQWIWLSVKYKSLTLPSAINPAILSGGLIGEGKLDYFESMGAFACAYVATYTSFVNQGAASLAIAQATRLAAGLSFPIIVKPDIGWCGFGVRLVRDNEELADYIKKFPLGETIILQEYLPQEGEAGLYYVRYPGEQKGRLIAILLRYFPCITGDGMSSVAQLIAKDDRLARLGRDGLSEAGLILNDIPLSGHRMRVTTIGSTRVGGRYEDATCLISPALTNAIDLIAQDMDNFHVGRFDVRYENISALAAGECFTIMEVNGAGSEAVHAWDPIYTLREAYAIVFAKQRMLFEIGDAMRMKGHKPIGIWKLIHLYLRQRNLILRYPPSN
jgi:Carbamoyl-phosphate synthase L chain, ATP binding domain